MSLPYQQMWSQTGRETENSHMQSNSGENLNREMAEVTEGHVEVDLIIRATEQAFDGASAMVSLIDEANALLAQKCCISSESVDIASGAFSSQNIREGGFLEVCDARFDGRFAASPLVTGGPNIVYYAGVPLRLKDGSIPGAFAIISHKPRSPISADEIALLERFAARISQALEGCLDS